MCMYILLICSKFGHIYAVKHRIFWEKTISGVIISFCIPTKILMWRKSLRLGYCCVLELMILYEWQICLSLWRDSARTSQLQRTYYVTFLLLSLIVKLVCFSCYVISLHYCYGGILPFSFIIILLLFWLFWYRCQCY
jgi:hypothetical protein